MNGNCQGFENFDACYQGRCWWGRCIPTGGSRAWGSKTLKNVKPMNASIAMSLMESMKDQHEMGQPTKPTKMLAPRFSNCYNRSPCCDAWADKGLCSAQPEYMGLYCGISCGSCTPSFNGGSRAWGSKTLKNVKPMNASIAMSLMESMKDQHEMGQPTKPTKMLAPKFSNCYNRSPCCDAWADKGLCSAQPEYMGLYCGISCGSCTPSFNVSSTGKQTNYQHILRIVSCKESAGR
ncbi:shTK domain protein [Ancylostoma duodenale]|uniref:ShTK domain protein n=1 Tax=Ancylostoma duodenale TaxID=51022 RepID=A0A0C2GIN2_9BILA|nr:shTK domain protein [Ancylostoma duodenale]